MAIADSIYITPENVQAMLAMQYKTKEFHIDDVSELCAQAVLTLLGDVSTMHEFEEVPLVVENNRVKLPCNVYTIHDVYDSKEKEVRYFNRGIYLYSLKDYHDHALAEGDAVYINYAGIPVNDNGELLIFADAQIVCETWCKLRLFEEEVGRGLFDRGLWTTWHQLLPGQIASARQSMRHLSKADKTAILYIKGNMLPKIGPMELKHKRLDGWSSKTSS